MKNADHPDYNVWSTMKTRCQNERHHTYANYGAKGISVCSRWQNFEAFAADMGPRPEGWTLDRKDSKGNYEPGNCRWATRRQQNDNRGTYNRVVELYGKEMTLGAAIHLGGANLGYGTVDNRLKRGWDLERAVTEPVMRGQQLRQRLIEGSAKGKVVRYGNRAAI